MRETAVTDVREYHERTKHTYESVRRSGRMLDWSNFPRPFKEYVGLAREPLPNELARLLRLGGGVVRSRGDYHFRTYSSAGALYPNELYVSRPDGLFHFNPGELSVRRLRPEGVLGEALGLTGIQWRTGWKYGERGYRHLYWDAGTMLTNLLVVAQAIQARRGSALLASVGIADLLSLRETLKTIRRPASRSSPIRRREPSGSGSPARSGRRPGRSSALNRSRPARRS